MTQGSTSRTKLWRSCLIGSVAGAGLLSGSILFFGWYDRHTNWAYEKPVWYDGLSFFPALHGVWSGGSIGAVVGVSLWALRTRRPLHPLLTMMASVVLSVTVCTVLHIAQNTIAASQKSGASGEMAHAFGFIETYMFWVFPGSVIIGIIFGFIRIAFQRSNAGRK